MRGEADLVLRTFVAGPDGTRREVGGAACDVRSILFETHATTPARLALPIFGPQSPTLAVDCHAGRLTGIATVSIAVRWLGAPVALPGPGPWGRSYGAGPWGWSAWSGPAYPVFFYPDVAVTLAESASP